jgi:hypothetical protein
MCFGAYHPGAGRACTVGYQIEPGHSISYRFHDDQVFRENLAAFDLAVRTVIATHRVPEHDADRAE